MAFGRRRAAGTGRRPARNAAPSGPDLGPPPGGGAFEEATVVPTGHEVATLYRVAAPGHLNCRRIVDWRWRWARRPEARETGWDVVRCGPLGLFVLATRLEPWPGEPGG